MLDIHINAFLCAFLFDFRLLCCCCCCVFFLSLAREIDFSLLEFFSLSRDFLFVVVEMSLFTSFKFFVLGRKPANGERERESECAISGVESFGRYVCMCTVHLPIFAISFSIVPSRSPYLHNSVTCSSEGQIHEWEIEGKNAKML